MISIRDGIAQLEAAGVPRHKRKLALQRLRALKGFWRAAADANGRNLTKLRVQIAAEMSAKNPAFSFGRNALRTWEAMFRRGGVVALSSVAGPQSTKMKAENILERMPMGELAAYAACVSGILASRMARA